MARSKIVGLLGLVCMVSACAGSPSLPTARVPAPLLTAPYQVHPGDVLEVKFEFHPQDDRRVTVGTDGVMSLPVTGKMQVGGLSVREVEELVETESSRFLRGPVVSVTIIDSQARAYVEGEVVNPGFVSLVKPMTALQAVVERGGFLPTANRSEILVLSHAAGRPVARRLDIKKELSRGRLGGPILLPNEVVVVPKTGIAKANQVVDQYINRMTPTIVRQLRFGTINVR